MQYRGNSATTTEILGILDLLVLAHMAPEAEQQKYAGAAQAALAQLREKIAAPVDYDRGGAA